jgi:hypothetical protein
MTPRHCRLALAVAVLSLAPLVGSPLRMEQAPAQKATRAIELDDIIAWKTIGATTLSTDGQWFAYRLSPGEGNAQIVVRRARSDKEMRYDIGEQPTAADAGGGGGRGGAGTPSAALAFSDNTGR